jgi:hypothetical protein
MLARYKSPALALEAYNAGPGRVDAYLSGKSSLPAETTNYVSSILNKGNAMPLNTPALGPQAAAGGPGALFGGANSSFGTRLGEALKGLGAGLIAPYDARGAAEMMKANNMTSAALLKNKYGLTPVWAQDAQGNYVPMQMNSAGGVVPLSMPNGLKAVLPTQTINMGGLGTGILRRGDTSPVTIVPKAGEVSKDFTPVMQNGQPTGAFQPAEGTPAETTQTQGYRKALSSLHRFETQSQLVNDKIDQAIKQIDGGVIPRTGFAANFAPLYGTPQHDLGETLQTIRSNLSLDALQQLREASPTGGALGQISDFEDKLLAATKGSIDQGQSAEQIKAALRNIQKNYQDTTSYARKAFAQDYGKYMQQHPDRAPETMDTPSTPKVRTWNPATGALE